MVPVALAAVWFGSPFLPALVALLGAGMGWEWARMSRLQSPSAVLFAILGPFVAACAMAFQEGVLSVLLAIVFAAGVAIAVLAGMVAAPVSSVYPGMGNTVLIVCFVVVVIGGIGSIRGALLAALLIGVVDTFGKVLLPQAAGVLVYVLMALILLWKPDGLFKVG